MKQRPIFFLIIIFLLLGLCSNGQEVKDSLVVKGDTTFLFFKNGCLHEKGIWKKNKWVGKYYLYYKNTCGQLWLKVNYDTVGRFISSQEYDREGNFITLKESDGKGNFVVRKGNQYISSEDSIKQSKIQREYSVDKNKEFERAIFSGDSCLAISHFNCAIEQYNVALNIKPNDNYAFKQLAKADHDCDSVYRMISWGQGQSDITIRNSKQNIVTKGMFHGCEFISGEQRIYDRDGKLIQIKLYKDGKYVGDAPLPIEEK